MISNKRLKELAEFLGKDFEDLRNMDSSIQNLPGFTKWINVAMDKWRNEKIDENKREVIENWYKKNEIYLLELNDVHSRPTKQRIIKNLIKLSKKYKIKSYLDYGGGIGEESIMMAKNGFNVSM